MILTKYLLLLIFAGTFGGQTIALNDPSRQARSVHLYYFPQAENADSAMVTVTVTEAQTNSYYMALGWDSGYCGLQDVRGERVFIFSVWEPGDPTDMKAREADVKDAIRAKAVFVGEGVDAARFEREGTGMRTMKKFDWKEGEPVTVRIDAEPDGDDRMIFTAFVRKKNESWTKIASISTICREPSQRRIHGIYSFVEDFWRNGESARRSRGAEFRGIRMRNKGTGTWVTAQKARFTADATPSGNIDAGPTGDGGGFLKTGGATKNEHVKLWGVFKL